VGRDAGDPQVASWGLQNLAFPGIARGPLALTEARLREGQGLARSIPSWDNLMFQKGLLAKCLVLQGRLDEAQAEVDEALAIIVREHLDLPFDQAEVLTAAATVANARAERVPANRRAAAEALAAAKRAVRCTRRMPLWLPQALRLQGSALWLSNDHVAARAAWRESLTLAERFVFPVECGRTLLEMGRHDADEDKLAQAVTLFRRTGAQVHLAQALQAQMPARAAAMAQERAA